MGRSGNLHDGDPLPRGNAPLDSRGLRRFLADEAVHDGSADVGSAREVAGLSCRVHSVASLPRPLTRRLRAPSCRTNFPIGREPSSWASSCPRRRTSSTPRTSPSSAGSCTPSATRRWPRSASGARGPARARCSARGSSRSSRASPAARASSPRGPPTAPPRRGSAGRRRPPRTTSSPDEEADGAGPQRRGRGEAHGGGRRPRAVPEPAAKSREGDRRAGARSHRRHRRHLPPPRPQPRGAHAGRDGPAEVPGAPAARVGGPVGAPAGAGRGRLRGRARSPQDPRPAGGAEGGAGRRFSGIRITVASPGRTSCGWPWSATPTPASRR